VAEYVTLMHLYHRRRLHGGDEGDRPHGQKVVGPKSLPWQCCSKCHNASDKRYADFNLRGRPKASRMGRGRGKRQERGDRGGRRIGQEKGVK